MSDKKERSIANQEKTVDSEVDSKKAFSLLFVPEILAEICEYVESPKELYSLSAVCRKLRDLLWSNSIMTQKIWRDSRFRLEDKKTQPPKGMSEQQYIWLKHMGVSCQYCRSTSTMKNKWEFKRLCCEECVQKKTTSRSELLKKKIPEELLSCLPYAQTISHFTNDVFFPIHHGSLDDSCYYWTDDVYAILAEYNELNENNKKAWLEKRQTATNEYIAYINEIKSREQNELIVDIFKKFLA
ncbi:17123_t:CDS:2 [Acaulospora morrowiae]|uniref:17123_t:CDS:1 n=1 Tax=Acaulospora morrowiae TaxID=94023 RepID=A0A9N9HX54_9GLOM|nr:17123_t:CDS:2 [Acaulospora morrowiae]